MNLKHAKYLSQQDKLIKKLSSYCYRDDNLHPVRQSKQAICLGKKKCGKWMNEYK